MKQGLWGPTKAVMGWEGWPEPWGQSPLHNFVHWTSSNTQNKCRYIFICLLTFLLKQLSPLFFYPCQNSISRLPAAQVPKLSMIINSPSSPPHSSYLSKSKFFLKMPIFFISFYCLTTTCPGANAIIVGLHCYIWILIRLSISFYPCIFSPTLQYFSS